MILPKDLKLPVLLAVWQLKQQRPFMILCNLHRSLASGQPNPPPAPNQRSQGNQHLQRPYLLHPPSKCSRHPLGTQHLLRLCKILLRHLLRETRKHCSAINVVHVCGQANASATTVEPSCRSPLLYKIFLQALISRDNTLHLLLVPSSIRMITLGKRAIATFYLLLSCIWRQTQRP